MSEITVRLTADDTLIQMLQTLLGGRAQPEPVRQPSLPVPAAALPALPAPLPVAPGPGYTIDQLMRAGAELVDQGRMAEVMALMQQFGVQAITQLPVERYGDMATAMRGMGASL